MIAYMVETYLLLLQWVSFTLMLYGLLLRKLREEES